jgi:hypothetical protein
LEGAGASESQTTNKAAGNASEASKSLIDMIASSFGWRLAPLGDPGMPDFIARGALPDPATARCELCERRPRQPLSTMLVVDGPAGLPVPFLICAQCRRTLDQLHAMLEAAQRPPAI